MPLLDFRVIQRRATLLRQRAGLADAGPPYHTHDLFAAVPDLSVAGADLPRGVLEMAERTPDGRRILWYARGAPPPLQRVALAHGLYHFMTDLAGPERAVRECNAAMRELEEAGKLSANPIERACDLFAGELLVPFAVLDQVAPMTLFPEEPAAQARWADQVDELASLFNVPPSFMRWRLWDLSLLRRSNFYV